MLRNALLVGAAVIALGAVSAPAQAADNIVLNTWYAFNFQATGSALNGGGIPGTSPNGLAAPQTPWTITLSGPGKLTVTDVEIPGDQFTLYDNGVLLGTTSAPTPDFGVNVGECISCALGDPEFSKGVFLLGAGVHNFTGVQDGVINFGDGDFKVSLPEPGTWAMMMIGLGGIGAAMRSRRKAVLAAT